MLKIYNSLTRQKDEFVPIHPGRIRIYVCGMTVYDLCHVGHARVMVVFDMIVRYLRYVGFDVTYVRNITDIDDKIIQRANESNEPIHVLTERYIKAMNEDALALGVLPPDQEPRATEHMDQIIKMISALIEKKHAYLSQDNDIYFDVSSYADYGKLSGRNIDELRAGERVEVRQEKDDPLDFALWKAAKQDEPGWQSPWGVGRPGWHIECSAMSIHCLGEHFDIHGGGQDLQFPHHENEIAQSVCATDVAFANIWIHNGFVKFDDVKMAKSLGNFFTIREVLQKFKPEVLRFFILSSHYRSPLNYSVASLTEAQAALTGFYTALRGVDVPRDVNLLANYVDEFNACMDDDFNTPKAVSLLHELARSLNSCVDKSMTQALELAFTLKQLGAVLGIIQTDPDSFLQMSAASNDDFGASEIEELIAVRATAKSSKDYEKADQIRAQLIAAGISLEDTPQGTIWRRH